MKTLKLRIKDKHAEPLNKLASSVNFVWNYVNDLSFKHLLTKTELLLAVRLWHCPSCLQQNDRDINASIHASINILHQALLRAKHSKTVGATGLAELIRLTTDTEHRIKYEYYLRNPYF